MLEARRALGPLGPSDFLFADPAGCPLSYGFVARVFKVLVKLQSLSGVFALHSFRIGGATALEAAGLPDHVIQAAGRWNSDAFKLYCRTSVSARARWSSLMASAVL